MGRTRPLIVDFRQSQKYSLESKYVDVVLWTWDHRMVGADDRSTNWAITTGPSVQFVGAAN